MRGKRWIGVSLIVGALLIMLLPVSEADAETSASDFVIVGETLKKYKGKEKNVTIPKSVEIIGEGAFQENTAVEQVTLPDSVKTIEAYSFWGCDNLKTVVLGKGLKEIGDLAFNNCTGLQYMTIPANIRSIGIQAFAYCSRLEDITIPPEVISIREDSFDGDYLLNIRCEPGSYADRYAQDFYERQKKMPVYEMPAVETPDSSNVGAVDGGEGSDPYYEIPRALLGSTHVVGNQAVVLMQGAGLGAVNGGEDSTPEQEVPDMPSDRIPERAYYRNAEVTEAELQEGLIEIEPFAYARSGLSRLVLPYGLQKIDYAAFYHCDDLAEVELPDTVTEVAPKAFAHTAWVRNFLNGTDTALEESLFEESLFLISGGVLVAYRGSAESVTVPDGVRVIAGEAFADHSELREIILPESLQGVGERAFVNCEPESVQYAGTALTQGYLEECVRLTDLSAGPAVEQGFRWTWIAAIFLLLTGGFCLVGKRA